MLKKTITYTDFDGNERTEDFYFNLTKAEILEMELEVDGGFTAYLQKIVNTKSVPSLIKIFKDMIIRAYGEKSPDGRRFIKNKELTDSFVQTEAYSSLFIELSTDDEAAAAFINGIVPKDVAEEAAKQQLTTAKVLSAPEVK